MNHLVGVTYTWVSFLCQISLSGKICHDTTHQAHETGWVWVQLCNAERDQHISRHINVIKAFYANRAGFGGISINYNQPRVLYFIEKSLIVK